MVRSLVAALGIGVLLQAGLFPEARGDEVSYERRDAGRFEQAYATGDSEVSPSEVFPDGILLEAYDRVPVEEPALAAARYDFYVPGHAEYIQVHIIYQDAAPAPDRWAGYVFVRDSVVEEDFADPGARRPGLPGQTLLLEAEREAEHFWLDARSVVIGGRLELHVVATPGDVLHVEEVEVLATTDPPERYAVTRLGRVARPYGTRDAYIYHYLGPWTQHVLLNRYRSWFPAGRLRWKGWDRMREQILACYAPTLRPGSGGECRTGGPVEVLDPPAPPPECPAPTPPGEGPPPPRPDRPGDPAPPEPPVEERPPPGTEPPPPAPPAPRRVDDGPPRSTPDRVSPPAPARTPRRPAPRPTVVPPRAGPTTPPDPGPSPARTPPRPTPPRPATPTPDGGPAPRTASPPPRAEPVGRPSRPLAPTSKGTSSPSPGRAELTKAPARAAPGTAPPAGKGAKSSRQGSTPGARRR